jgi:FAD synthetase
LNAQIDKIDHRTRDLLRLAYLLQLRKGFFTLIEFSEKANLGHDEGMREIRRLIELKLINRRDTRDLGHGMDTFQLTQMGRSALTVVITGGVFDVLHLGHVAALAEAKRLGDVLVVVVATDATVEMFKGRRPIFPENERRKLVEALKPVDAAILGYEDVGMGYDQVMREVDPDVVALGYDQLSLERTLEELIRKKGFRARIIKLTCYKEATFPSSTAIRQKIVHDDTILT